MIPEKKPTLKDKLVALQNEQKAVEAELGATKKAKKRAEKEGESED